MGVVATTDSARGRLEGVRGVVGMFALASSATTLVIGAKTLARTLVSIAEGFGVTGARRWGLRTARLLLGSKSAVRGG